MAASLSSRILGRMTSSASLLVGQLRGGDLSAASQVEDLAGALAGMDPQVHGFSHLALDTAHDRAALLDALPPSRRGRLHGLPLPVKDLNDVAGMPTSHGSAARTRMAGRTDPFLVPLLAQGAVVPGKTAACELGLTIYTEPPGLPFPDNPLWPGHTPGGSSGGAAVLVARGLLPAAHASDGGGSIRVPAAACGIVGFKPSSRTLSAQGFLTRTLADAAFLHDIVPVTGRRRIGVLTQPLFTGAPVDQVMLDAVGEAADRLADAGHDVVELSPYPQAEDTFAAFTTIFTGKLAALPDPVGGIVAWLRERGREVAPQHRLAAFRHARGLPRFLAQFWNVDAVLTPMLTTDPPPIGHFAALDPAEDFQAQTRWSPWGSLFNMTCTPAVSLPWPVPGRPSVGVQLGSIRLDDAGLLGLAGEVHP